MAKEINPATIFFDGMELLTDCGSESEGEQEKEIRLTLIGYMQNQQHNSGVQIFGATKEPWNLHKTVQRCFVKKIYVPMPDEEARTTIIKNLVSKSKHEMTEEDWIILGKESVSFTVYDCIEAVKKTMLTPAQKCQSAKRFKKTKDGGWVPTISSDLEG